MANDDCLFCRMGSGEIAVDKVVENREAFAIRDINPRAPVHLLVIPRRHVADARHLEWADKDLLAGLFKLAAAAAKEEGVSEDGYRLAFNVGNAAGMTISHLHLHLVGGRKLGPEGLIRSIAQQIEAVRAEMTLRPQRLQEHVERVLVEALDLAARFDIDPERVELATRGHDLFRATAPAELLRLSREAGVAIDPADEASPVMLHGPLAAEVLRERFEVRDEEALAAVRDHTSGSAAMPILAKIILLADKFERRKRRRRPVMAEIRRLARRDLDAAMLCWADWKWVLERERGWATHPQHWAARQEWVAEHHADAGLPARTHDSEWPGPAGATE